jgi:NADP-dependent 3-hydroxy acid dehydrogenase YdfG
MAQKLAGRVAVITGARAGIEWASAVALAAEGARRVVTARGADRLVALAAQIRTRGSDAIAVAGDARAEETAQRTVRNGSCRACEIGAVRPVVARECPAQERPPWRGYLVQRPRSNRLCVWLAAR